MRLHLFITYSVEPADAYIVSKHTFVGNFDYTSQDVLSHDIMESVHEHASLQGKYSAVQILSVKQLCPCLNMVEVLNEDSCNVC